MNAYRVFFLVLFYFFFSGARARAFDDALLTLSDPVNVLLKKFERYKLQLFSRVIVGTVLFFLARREFIKTKKDARPQVFDTDRSGRTVATTARRE